MAVARDGTRRQSGQRLAANHLAVVLHEATTAGRLYPRYDDAADLLVVESLARPDLPYGVNVDSLVLFDLDSERKPVDFELLRPRRLWQVVEPFPETPRSIGPADLAFTEATVQRKHIRLPVHVITNAEHSCVRITFGRGRGAVEAVELSAQCMALIAGEQLIGFDLVIPPWTPNQRRRLHSTVEVRPGSNNVAVKLQYGAEDWGLVRRDQTSGETLLHVLPRATGESWTFEVNDLLVLLERATRDAETLSGRGEAPAEESRAAQQRG